MQLTDIADALRDELAQVFPAPEFEVLVDSVPSLDKGLDPLVQVYKQHSFSYVSVYLRETIHCKFADDFGSDGKVEFEYQDPDSVDKIVGVMRRHFANAGNSHRLSRRT